MILRRLFATLTLAQNTWRGWAWRETPWGLRMTHDLSKKFALAKLLGCYFHQDWVAEFDSDITALRAMTELEPKLQVVAGLSEIDWLLTQNLTEEDLRTILVDEIGCYFEPASKDMTWKEWLQRVRSAFSER